MENEVLERVKSIVKNAESIVFFGGAGMSTESGIPDFRSADGIYNQSYDYPPEEVLSRTFFDAHPDVFYDFYRAKSLKYILAAKPNKGHIRLAELEKDGRLKAVVTQNIDGLHRRAGSENVFELHGTSYKNFCTRCGKEFDINYVFTAEGVARCDECGGVIHPGIVLYEEPLDEYVMRSSIEYISKADVLIVAGTSMAVYPAAGLVDFTTAIK